MQQQIGNDPTGAIFSPCRTYRYLLWRIWDTKKPLVLFIGLNPSTADETKDDPTIRRVQQSAKDWKFGGVYMMNLFAYRTPYPSELFQCSNPIGENDYWLQLIAPQCSEVIFAWGSSKGAQTRAAKVIPFFPNAKALVLNKDGSPRHPLYVRAGVEPVPFIQKEI